MDLTAYPINDNHFRLEKPPKKRKWMDEHSDNNFPYRCLPMLMANTMGWDIVLPFTLNACWRGDGIDMEITDADDKEHNWMGHMSDDFGKGILTFRPGFLLKTPELYNVLITGPFNRPRKYIQPLSGMVETDWGHSFFTINWQFMGRNCDVTFEKGEPVARAIPYPRKLLENVEPEIKELSENPELETEYKEFARSRKAFNARGDKAPDEWQKDYMQGKTLTDAGKKCPYHQTTNKHKEFEKTEKDGE